MTLIPYPSVPDYPGVPQIPRTAPGSPSINVSIASPQSNISSQTTNELPWGIYTYPANQPLYAPAEGGTLSVLSFGFTRSMQVCDFPVEANNANRGAGFASFNKVYQPANPVLVLALSGTEGEKIAFLAAIDAACGSTTLFNVYTPDASYSGSTGACTMERYSYQRTAVHNATMLTVEVSMKQIMQVTASLSNVSTGSTPISSPQSPSAQPQINNGITQTSTPPVSWLARAAQGLGIGANQ